MSNQEQTAPLRVVTFNVLPIALQMVMRWAADSGNRLILAVTTPGPSTRRTPSYRELVAAAPPELDVLVTTRLRRVALPLIRELRPDLIVCFSFPYRLPPELWACARYGAVNLHPAPLPAYRGPNVMRLFYEGWPTFGATLHWMADDYDTGNMLSQQTAPLPTDVTPQSIMALWPALITSAFAEGIARAVAGEPGVPQDHSQASYAAPFTEDEYWLDWRESRQVLQRKTTALNLLGGAHAQALIQGQPYSIAQINPLPAVGATESAGTVLEKKADGFVIQVGDGQVHVIPHPLPAAVG